jgi:hypothetical protein
MSLFTVVCHSGTNTQGFYHSDDFYEAQLMLHQLAEEHAAEQRAQAVEQAASSAVKSEFIADQVDKLCYVQDGASKQQKLVYQTPVLENGFLRECYCMGEPELRCTYQLVSTDAWTRQYFNFLEWTTDHSVTLVTNGSEQERRACIMACLTQSAVDLESPPPQQQDAAPGLEEKPQPNDDYKPLFIALTEHCEQWSSFCDHVEPYSDVAIAKILDEQDDCRRSGELLDDVVIVLEVSTPNMLMNDMVLELCERCNDLQMSVMISVPMDERTRLPKRVQEAIHFVFNLHPHGERSFQPLQQMKHFEEGLVYDLDKRVYGVETVAWQSG